MKVGLDWLSEYADAGLPVRELADKLTMTGTMVEAVHHHGVPTPEGFVVGKVLTREQHPDADRLGVCTVDLGDGEEPSQIVCGAPNVAAGQTVAVVKPGAVMPDGTKIKKAKLRGVASSGMILSERELQLSEEHDGIMVLDDALAAGTPLAEVLPIATDVLEFEITPNRPDCLGVYGIAREIHATTGAPLAIAPWWDDPGTLGPVEGVSVEVQVPELCPRFTARVFEDVKIGPSPQWLKARLSAAGIRSISNVVDITNYAMLLTGQPLHAFDLDQVAGSKLVVRAAREGETIDTLDGQTRTLLAGEIVIDDADGPTSLAGVMGGARSEVSDATTRVLMEVAAWHAPTIQKTSNRLALRSEASGRFEKGLSPGQTMEAQSVATQLMIELAGARVVDGTIDVAAPWCAEDAPKDEPLILRPQRVEQLLGKPIAREEQSRILTSLGFGVTETDDELLVDVPHFRAMDISREADLVEEVARIDGLDNLPATLPSRRGASGRLTTAQRGRRRAEDALVGRGLSEIVGWSFTEPSVADRLKLDADDPRRRFVKLANPMSEDQSHLRTTLLGSLLDAAKHNVARGQTDLQLFESGTIYLARSIADDAAGLTPDGDPIQNGAGSATHDTLPLERHALGGLVVGNLLPESWGTETRAWDFFALKGIVGAVLDTLRVDWDVRADAPHPFLHPGRSARVYAGEVELGWVGELHPLVAREWDVEGAVAAFELDLGLVVDQAPETPQYADVTSFPAVRQDLAVVVPDTVSAQQVLDTVRRAGGKLLSEADVFDVYRGAQVGEGKVSLALHLEFRAADRTLSDKDVKKPVDKVVAALGSELGAEQRG
ncbi:MAG TPA: phenylalanine--tRNA ligase subunit beta [Solirubrobacteraceae bacterium]|nr:phenylalanine--tRNA ligase subunit beta [Solirubrobacteraceae bacterium]